MFLPDGNQIIGKTYMTTVEGKNMRLRHSASTSSSPDRWRILSKGEMLKHSMRLVIHYLKFGDVSIPYPGHHFNRSESEANWVAKTSLEGTYHTYI
jgi:insertion element IS1 protein InsB